MFPHYLRPSLLLYALGIQAREREYSFLGSGTQLIAAEKLGRVCYAMEREPEYVDVAIHRWEAFTGETAVQEGKE